LPVWTFGDPLLFAARKRLKSPFAIRRNLRVSILSDYSGLQHLPLPTTMILILPIRQTTIPIPISRWRILEISWRVRRTPEQNGRSTKLRQEVELDKVVGKISD
jgi:hypothetical protein